MPSSPTAETVVPDHPAQLRQSALHRGLRVGYLSLVTLTLVFGAWMAWANWQRLSEHLQSTLRIETAFLADTATAFFQRYEAVMTALAGDLQPLPGGGLQPDVLQQMLHRYRTVLSPSQALAVHLTEPSGRVLASTLLPANAFSAAGVASAARESLQIGRAEFVPQLGRWAIPLRLTAPGGATGAPVSIVMLVDMNEFLARWQHSVVAARDLMPGMVIAVNDTQGYRLARWPEPPAERLAAFYQHAASAALAQALRAAPDALSGMVDGRSSEDGQVRVGAWVRLAPYPAAVSVSVPRALLWRDFWRSYWPIGVSLLAWLVLLTLAWRLLKRQFDNESAQLRERVDIMYRLANQDSLTGLFNRRGLGEILQRVHDRAIESGEGYALILFDLDHFKLINDGYGHAAGDVVLQQVAHLLQTQLRHGDETARWGGEEFLIVLPQTDLEGARLTAEKLRKAISHSRLKVSGNTLRLAASFGVCAFDPTHPVALAELLSQADAALYNAKEGGRNRVCVFREGDAQSYVQGYALKRAIEEGRIRPAYQPLVELGSGRVVGCEALARLIDEHGQVISASKFIEVADRLRLEHRIDEQVSRRVMARCSRRIREGKAPLKFMINTSADFLSRPESVAALLDAARKLCETCGTDVTAADKPLVIEITERQLIGDARKVRELVQPLIDFGFQIAVDDFGSGYSSYLYLLQLPVSYVKIEAELVRESAHDPRAAVMVQSIHQMARALGIVTIAEGIEDDATLQAMRRIGIDWGQGYLWGPPEIEVEPVAPAVPAGESPAAPPQP